MQNILLVVDTPSYLVVQLQEKLENTSYNVITVNADTDAIHEIKEELCAILIYADEDLISKTYALTYLKDKAVEDELPVFVFGYSEEISAVEDYISKGLIQDHFTRPINVREAVSAIDSYLKKYGNQNKKKVLVVDDSGAMLRNVKGWLEDKYHVILANSGAMAIKYLALNRPDLVLLDYEMPVVDGKQVLEMIRTETDFYDIPVIFLTGRDDQESVMKVMELKVQGYLLKTMPPEQIVKTIDDFFEKQKGLKQM